MRDTFLHAAWPYLYFRIRGYGLHFMWKTPQWSPLFSERLFSERNGYVKALWIWKLRIKVLKP